MDYVRLNLLTIKFTHDFCRIRSRFSLNLFVISSEFARDFGDDTEKVDRFSD